MHISSYTYIRVCMCVVCTCIDVYSNVQVGFAELAAMFCKQIPNIRSTFDDTNKRNL